jgi:6-phosphofructokinase 1
LGICKASGAALAIIPEEYPHENFSLDLIVDTLAGAVVKRRANGHNDGVAVIAEGVAELLPVDALDRIEGVERDAYGHVRLSEVPLGNVLRSQLKKRLEEIGVGMTIVAKDIGYELRCAKPVPFDIEYTRTLGYGAVQYLLRGGSGALVALCGGRVTPLTFADLQDPHTGRIRVRRVDVTTEGYQMARSYMTRLEPEDLEEPNVARLAAATDLTPGAFREIFARVAHRPELANV